MKGERAVLSVKMMRALKKRRMITMGRSQYFFRILRNPQKSLRMAIRDMIYSISKEESLTTSPHVGLDKGGFLHGESCIV